MQTLECNGVAVITSTWLIYLAEFWFPCRNRLLLLRYSLSVRKHTATMVPFIFRLCTQLIRRRLCETRAVSYRTTGNDKVWPRYSRSELLASAEFLATTGETNGADNARRRMKFPIKLRRKGKLLFLSSSSKQMFLFFSHSLKNLGHIFPFGSWWKKSEKHRQ